MHQKEQELYLDERQAVNADQSSPHKIVASNTYAHSDDSCVTYRKGQKEMNYNFTFRQKIE